MQLHHGDTELKPANAHVLIDGDVTGKSLSFLKHWPNSYANPRLIINGVQGSLHGSSLPPASSALVRQQVEAYEGVGAIFGEGDQVTEGRSKKKKNFQSHSSRFIASWFMMMFQSAFPNSNMIQRQV